jgi:hypothetical protein
MNKKTLTFTIVISIVIIATAVGYFLYNPIGNDQNQPNHEMELINNISNFMDDSQSQLDNQISEEDILSNKNNETPEDGQYSNGEKEVVIGTFEKVEDNLLYFKQENEENISSLEMSKDVVVKKMTLINPKNLGSVVEEEIDLSYFSKGSQISIIINSNGVIDNILSVIYK